MATVAEVGLFGGKTRSDTLLVISMLGETHASEIARVLAVSLSQTQRAIASLERAGVVIGLREGVERRVRLEPRSPYYEELKALLNKMGMHDLPLQNRLGELRRRPRRANKPL